MRRNFRIVSILMVILLFSMSVCMLSACKVEKFEVSYSIDGQQYGDKVIMDKGKEVKLPATPIKEDYTFDGWYNDSECIGEKISFPYTVNGNVKLYGKWIRTKGTDGLKYLLWEGSYYISGYKGLDKNVFIPSIYNEKDVTSIGYKAFYQCKDLESVEIPYSVTSISSSAFSGCTNLINIQIPNKVSYIGGMAFYNCSGLENVIIPKNVETIVDSAFSNCTGMKSLVFEEGSKTTNIAGNVFEYCSGLTSIVLPNGLTIINQQLFANCISLTSIVIPSGVTSISWNSFYNCTSLKSIVLPNSIESIESGIFYDCSSLENINYNGTKSQWNTITKMYWYNEITNSFFVTCTDGILSKVEA